jgi:hypothetical protein
MERFVKHPALVIATILAALLAATWYGLPFLLKPPLIAANRATAGLQEKTVSTPTHRIHYLDRERGSDEGPVPVLLLHGIFAEKDHWVDFARALPGQYRIIVPDLPGFGESGRLTARPMTTTPRCATCWTSWMRWACPGAPGRQFHGRHHRGAAGHPAPWPGASVAFIGSPHGHPDAPAQRNGPANRRRPVTSGCTRSHGV